MAGERPAGAAAVSRSHPPEEKVRHALGTVSSWSGHLSVAVGSYTMDIPGRRSRTASTSRSGRSRATARGPFATEALAEVMRGLGPGFMHSPEAFPGVH